MRPTTDFTPRLAVAGAEVGVADVGERPRGLGSHLRGAGAEAPVAGDELGRKGDGGGVDGHRGEITGGPSGSRCQFREQAHLALDELVPVAEVEALVLAVDAAARIGGAEEQRGDAAERVGERTDERDGAADAHVHGIDAEAGAQRALGGVERPAGRVAVPRGHRVELGDRVLEPERDASLEVRAQRGVESSGSWPRPTRTLMRAAASATIWFDDPAIGWPSMPITVTVGRSQSRSKIDVDGIAGELDAVAHPPRAPEAGFGLSGSAARRARSAASGGS